MKKILLMFVLMLGLLLSSCEKAEELLGVNHNDSFEYSDFTYITINSHAEAEGKSNDKHIIYFYQELCSHCQAIKQDILGFADTFNDLEFYIFDISKAQDASSLQELVRTPTIFVFSGTEIIKSYIGKDKVLLFIEEYENLSLEYSSFNSQTLTTYNEILNIESSRYFVYYYLEGCAECIEIKSEVLAWAFTKNVNDMYIMDRANIEEPNDIPSELEILTSGTPILIVMNNGVYTDEYYIGKDEILDFIELDT